MTSTPSSDHEALRAVAKDAWDVLVLGAGPAGALAALEMARAGARVVLVERKRFPRQKVCGACLNQTALAVLERSGLGGLVDRLGGVTLAGLRVRLEGRDATFRLPAGKALARDVLDAGLAREAVSAGAVFLDGTTARVSLVREGNRLAVALERRGIQETTHARVVVIAGGLAPAGMQRARGLATRIAPEARVGAGCLLADSEDTLNYESHAIHMAVGRGGYVGVVRLAGGFLNVAAAFDREFVRERGGPGPAAVAILAEARAHPLPQLVGADWSGTAPLTRSTRPVAGHRVLLVGDVAGYVEPFTGEGMGAALLGGRAVADVALRGIDDWAPTLASEWARRHRCLVARRHAVIRALATAARRPWLARAVLGLAARSPRFSGALIRRVNPSP